MVIPNKNLKALPPGDAIHAYRGVGLCYRGNDKWVVGLMPLVGGWEEIEWIDDLSFDEALLQIESQKKRFIAQSDKAVFGV